MKKLTNIKTMKKIKIPVLSLITFLAIFLFLYKIASAQNGTEISATPEVFSEPGAKLLLAEVNFKNKENDWVELYYESPSRKPLNLKGFEFKDDSVFKKVGQDFWIQSHEYLVLTFKSSGQDNQSGGTLGTTRTGLTGTTEQIILLDPSGKIIDALCWANSTPTADETTDMNELFQNEGWISPNPSSCIQSEKVSTNQSLIRINTNDTDSMKDWTVTDDVTPGTGNNSVSTPEITTQTTTTSTGSSTTSAAPTRTTPATAVKTITAAPASPSITPKQVQQTPKKSTTTAAQPKTVAKKTTTATKKSTTPKTTTKAAAKSTKPKYKNGDLSGDIIISEIFPRAAKDDRTNEWIELTNTGEQEVTLGNWQVDDADGGSKPYILPDTLSIPAQTALLIKAPDSKLSLSNTKDSVRLFDPAGKLIQSVEYEEAPKEQSYAWVTITGDASIEPGNTASQETSGYEFTGTSRQQWVWEDEPTPGQPNPPYQELSGIISGDAEFNEIYRFTIQTADNMESTITFTESAIAGPLAKATFTKGTRIKILVSESAQSAVSGEPPQLKLKKYEITGTAQPQQNQESPWFLYGLLPPGGAGFWYGIKKLKKLYGKI